MKKEFPSMKEKDGKRKEIPTIGIRVFGYQIWFQAEGGRAFRRACRMAGRLCRNAEAEEEKAQAEAGSQE